MLNNNNNTSGEAEAEINLENAQDLIYFAPSESKTAFSYQTLNVMCSLLQTIECGDYTAYCDPLIKEFFFLKILNPTTVVNMRRTTGMKLHISLYDSIFSHLKDR